jgi:hypothetical protein
MCRQSPIASQEKAKRLADSLITRLLTTFRANPTSQQKAISYQRFVRLLAWIFAEEIPQLEVIRVFLRFVLLKAIVIAARVCGPVIQLYKIFRPNCFHNVEGDYYVTKIPKSN